MSVAHGAVTPAADHWSHERRARLALTHLVEPKTPRVLDWMSRFGAVEVLARLRSGRLDAEGAYAARLRCLDLPRAVHNLEVAGVRLVIPGDADWPVGVEVLQAPPLALFVKGPLSLAEASERAVAVVGSRAATSYGLHVATELGAGLVSRGVSVVSGAAFGIDAAAHRGALGVEGVTIAVLACGLDRPYPRAHAELIDRIAATGLVVSEIPLGGAPYRSRFLARNRLIATLSLGTVVVEASLRSGSLSTAKEARDHGRHVAAVPGPVTAMTSAGCHDLIRAKGAGLVTDAGEVLDLMGRMGFDLAPERRAPDTVDAELDARQRVVWSALPVRSPVSVDELAVRCGEHPRSLIPMLGRLELLGLAMRAEHGWRRASAPRLPGSRSSGVRSVGPDPPHGE